MADPSSSLQWIFIIVAFALLLAVLVQVQVLSTYTIAYRAAPREIAVFADTLACSIDENESYGYDVARVQRDEDRVRLSQLLEKIQKGGDDLREDLDQLLVHEKGTTLRASARILWASHRERLQERVRRLDLLRMRFLVFYMGVIAATATDQHEKERKVSAKSTAVGAEKAAPEQRNNTHRPQHAKGFLDAVRKKAHSLTPIKTRPTEQPEEAAEQPHRTGWLGVVQELQRSPLMAKRHASIEMAMKMPIKTSLKAPPKTQVKTPPISPPLSPPLSPQDDPFDSSPLLRRSLSKSSDL